MNHRSTASPKSKQIIFWVVIIIAVAALLFGLQSVALWLPYQWAYGLAANATVWPQLQLAIVALGGGMAMLLWRLGHRRVAVAGLVVSALSLVATVHMIVVLHQTAQQYGVPMPPTAVVNMLRADAPADQPSVRYATVDGRALYLSGYFARFEGTLPVVVYVHGGGWSGGSRTENNGFFRWLNGHGYNVISVDYRYASDSYASWRDAPRDIVCALAWVNRSAEKYHLDTRNVTIMGDSAGGQLALRAGYGVANGDVSPSCGGEPVRPVRIVAVVPAVDFRQLYNDPRLGPTSQRNVVRYLGGTPDTARPAYDESTIINHVSAGLPPTLIINAANDTLVSPDSGRRLAAALRGAGNTAEQYTLPYAVHSYWINPGGYQNQTAQTLMLRFLTTK